MKRMHGWWGTAIFLVIFPLSLLLGCSNEGRIDSFKRHCVEAGGHIYQPQIVFCLTEDGRMVEVYP